MEEARNRDRKYKKRYGTKANEYNIFRRLNTTIFISLLNANRKSNKMRNSIIPDIINISIININNDKFKYYNKRAFVYTIDPRFIHLYNFNIFPTPPMPIFISTRSTRRRLMNFATLIFVHITFASCIVRLLIPRYYFTRDTIRIVRVIFLLMKKR